MKFDFVAGGQEIKVAILVELDLFLFSSLFFFFFTHLNIMSKRAYGKLLTVLIMKTLYISHSRGDVSMLDSLVVSYVVDCFATQSNLPH